MPKKVTLQDWDPMNGRIYKNSVGANQFTSANNVALLATNQPVWSADAVNKAEVIGLIQDWNVSQTKQSPQLFECGSNGKYTVSTGRIAGSCNLSRVLFEGQSLMYLLYGGDIEVDKDKSTQLKYSNTAITDVAGYRNKDGTTGFAINLASSVFLNPLGIIISLRTAQAIPEGGEKNMAAFFLENAFINSHGIGASAGAPYVGEQVSITFEAVYPISARLGDQPWPPNPS